MKAVIGAGYGDEGKGLVTDYLCSRHGADVVVRFNGGAQAGHTVELPSGERHVFSHFGAGTFAGAATYLSSFFVVNPMAYFKELWKLERSLRSLPEVYVDPAAPVTTPYDMIINQLSEDQRGGLRHGSCGIGINETVTRTECDGRSALRFGDLSDRHTLREKLEKVRSVWFPKRCESLGVDPSPMIDVVNSQNVVDNFVSDAMEMYGSCSAVGPEVLLSAKQIVFEGAQGLMLDQIYAQHDYPHVTRSDTGLKNVLSVIEAMRGPSSFDESEVEATEDDFRLDVTYVTRCYATRHGAGPLSRELASPPFGVVDRTNVENRYQGKLRFAHLDVDRMKSFISADLVAWAKRSPSVYLRTGLAVTCLDQVGEKPCRVFSGGREEVLRGDVYGDVGDMIASLSEMQLHLKSFGPTRAHVVEGVGK